MDTANSAQSRSLRSWRTRIRTLDCKDTEKLTSSPSPISLPHWSVDAATTLGRWAKMGGKGQSSASPTTLRHIYFKPRPEPLRGESVQIAGQPRLGRCTEGITVQAEAHTGLPGLVLGCLQ
ncbi:unnamed protein product [Rangifer tarandus platyrhynchus]|uniref:Uncharacterized protein n=2 Tax=Rangifer tarandus platyrhynchus TaxID=3082113 RepID=A0ABN9A0B8_RANTA|nr:unnamed protein product [Rangifer tarandus platyrhynchus]